MSRPVINPVMIEKINKMNLVELEEFKQVQLNLIIEQQAKLQKATGDAKLAPSLLIAAAKLHLGLVRAAIDDYERRSGLK